MTELSGALDYLHSATAARAARHLAYVEDGLAMLALEKGAQLMQVGQGTTVVLMLKQSLVARAYASSALHGFGGDSLPFILWS